MDPDKWMELSARRNEVIEKAVNAADRIIFEGSDGSTEETDYLIAEVARKLMERALYHFQREILRKDTMGSWKDRCIICWELTQYAKDTPIGQRQNYFEGRGQVCVGCADELKIISDANFFGGIPPGLLP